MLAGSWLSLRAEVYRCDSDFGSFLNLRSCSYAVFYRLSFAPDLQTQLQHQHEYCFIYVGSGRNPNSILTRPTRNFEE